MRKRLLFSLITFVIFLLLAETAARLVETGAERLVDDPVALSGWQAKFFGSIFEWHEPDPDLLWRFRPNLDNQFVHTNSQGLLGGEISQTKEPSEYRVLLLGDSSPVGLGLDSYLFAFGEQVRLLLQVWFGEHRDVRLINASVSGYSSEQLAWWLEHRGWSFEPDVVVLYCGNNDASISGHATDRELMTDRRWRRFHYVLAHCALYRLLRSVLAPARETTVSDASQLRVRVSAERYGQNLRGMAKQCERHNCRLVIVKPPVPLTWPAGLQFKPFSAMKGADGEVILPPALAACLDRPIRYCLSSDRSPYGQRLSDMFTQAVYRSAFRDTREPAEAVQRYTESLEAEPHSPLLLNNLGVAQWELGDYEKADSYLKAARREHLLQSENSPSLTSSALGSVFLFNIGINLLSMDATHHDLARSDAAVYLDSALQADYLSLRIKRSYSQQIDATGKEYKNVLVVDAQTVFEQNGGDSLFIDHCHPTLKGHQLLASALFSAIANRQSVEP